MNYLQIDNVKIELTNEQVAEFKKRMLDEVELSTVKPGKVIELAGYEFIVLEHSKETTAVITKELLYQGKEFGKNNNYNGSFMDDTCNKFGNEIANIIGEENLIEHTVDLTADDGLKCYGSIKRKMSLFTANLYRRYVDILDKHKLNKWWWTATAYSTSKHGDTSWVKCVLPSGRICNYFYDRNYGVRPFCILKSSISVSCEE